MKFIRIIILLAAITPFMFMLSGCYNDTFLDAIEEEEDFIAPFDVIVTTEELKRTTYFQIPDTGSTAGFIAGDDASYTDTPRAVNMEVKNNVNADGHDIVEDHVTGLIWTKCTIISDGTPDTSDECDGSTNSSVIEWSKAASTCKNLTYADHKDWRLPRLPELLSIVDYGSHPAINDTVFPKTKVTLVVGLENVGYWTYSSKLFVDDNYNTAEYGWIVFHQGGGFWNLSVTNYKLKLKADLSFEKQFVRCVRGGAGDQDDVDF